MVIGTGIIGIFILAAKAKAAMPAITKMICLTRIACPFRGKMASARTLLCVVVVMFEAP